MDIPEDFLKSVEFLPDGTATNDQKVWLKAWSEYAYAQVLLGKIRLFDIEGFNVDTGEVPTQFIIDLYVKTRRSH